MAEPDLDLPRPYTRRPCGGLHSTVGDEGESGKWRRVSQSNYSQKSKIFSFIPEQIAEWRDHLVLVQCTLFIIQ